MDNSKTYSETKHLGSLLLIFLMYGLFGLSFVIGKKTLNFVSPFFLTAVRFLLAGFGLLLFQFVFQRKHYYVPKNAWWKLIIIGLFNVYLTNGLEFWGLQYMTSFKTCFIYSLSPFLAALLSYCFLHEKMTKMKWFGLIVGFAGFIPILMDRSGEEGFNLGFFSAAEIAVIGAALATVIGWITMRSCIHTNQCPFLMANAISMILGGFFSLITSSIAETWHPVPVISFWPFFWGMLVIVVITNFIGYNLYAYFLKRYSATFMSFCGFSTPIITAVFGWFVLKEHITLSFLISALLVFIGLYTFSKNELSFQKKSK